MTSFMPLCEDYMRALDNAAQQQMRVFTMQAIGGLPFADILKEAQQLQSLEEKLDKLATEHKSKCPMEHTTPNSRKVVKHCLGQLGLNESPPPKGDKPRFSCPSVFVPASTPSSLEEEILRPKFSDLIGGMTDDERKLREQATLVRQMKEIGREPELIAKETETLKKMKERWDMHCVYHDPEMGYPSSSVSSWEKQIETLEKTNKRLECTIHKLNSDLASANGRIRKFEEKAKREQQETETLYRAYYFADEGEDILKLDHWPEKKYKEWRAGPYGCHLNPDELDWADDHLEAYQAFRAGISEKRKKKNQSKNASQ